MANKDKCKGCSGWGGVHVRGGPQWTTCPACLGSGTTRQDKPLPGMGVTKED